MNEQLIEVLRAYTASLEQKIADLEQAASIHEQRLNTIEEKIALLEKRINDQSSARPTTNPEVEKKVTTFENKLAALGATVAELAARLDDDIEIEDDEEPEKVVEETPVEAPKQVIEEPKPVEHKEEPKPIEKPIAAPAKTAAKTAPLPGQPVGDLRQAISLGDRFLFQRELFNNQAEMLQKALTDINGLSSFDEAVNYISQFGWDTESKAYELFTNALHRRFA